MRQITWEQVAPLVQSARSDGTTAYITFACPASQYQVDTAAPLDAGGAEQRPLHGLAGLLARVFGRRRPESAASEPLAETVIVSAFAEVASHFAWDQATMRYVAAVTLSEMETNLQRILKEAIFETPAERLILARVLADVAAADGHLDPSERVFFKAVFGSAPGQDLEDIIALGAPTTQELQALRPALHVAVLVLATTMSLYDEIQDPGERARLDALAESLALSAEDQARAIFAAREHILDEAAMAALFDQEIATDERRSLDGLAQRLGATIEELVAIETRCRRRLGVTPEHN